MILLCSRRAANLHAPGVECSEAGDEDGAIENYTKALALDPARGDTLYNLDPIYKYRGACEIAGLEIEDWRANMRNLCKACSEARPHEGHDQALKEQEAWSPQRRVGFAALDLESSDGVLSAWAAKAGRNVSEIQCTLKAGLP